MDVSRFTRLATTAYADVIARDRVMDFGMRPLWQPIPRIAGPAYPVRNEPADNLMLHVAVHRAPAGSIIVCEAGDHDYAQAGGNVRAWAQKRVIPIPAKRGKNGVLNGPVTCGGVSVAPGDVVIADEEGIVVLPAAKAEERAIADLVAKLGIDA
jgi:4-hydroxy-4-methyl-2-oxoglutarate aldolase